MNPLSVVARGTWLYAHTRPMPVAIVRLDYDYWYEFAKAANDLEIGDVPRVDAEGHAYYVSYSNVRDGDTFRPDSVTHLSHGDARADAEARAPSLITWLETA
ncbi:hypothetical protein ACIA8G_37000 [Lentzea sp. NPDC051213]|uniref:hypothetical protein n=1 Tax=Lentzea sp. NPDC051213 TaxID=3364126 RepID=UPI00378F3FEC